MSKLDDTIYRMATPEQVEMEFELAGPGSRFCALVIDYLMIFLVILTLVIGAVIAGLSVDAMFSGGIDGMVSRWAIAMVIALIFLVTFGYFIFFESIMSGQTPGKRKMQIRVLREDGTPITFMDSLIRNLIRVVDFLPAAYLVGGLMCLFHPSHRRLGDLAAGTLVVKEGELDYRAKTDKKTAQIQRTTTTTANPELTAAERQTISSFMARRGELLPEARRGLARRLAQALHAKYGGDMIDPENYLQRLARNEHHER